MALTEDDKRWLTELIQNELHKWASPSDARMRMHSATLRSLDLEFEALRDKVEALEKRINERLQ